MKYSKVKEPVRLRVRELANGNSSLYLDIYRNGVRRYEFLKLYLIPERCAADRQRNAQTMDFANAIKAQRVVEMQASSHGLSAPTKAGRIHLIDYLREEQDACRQRGSDRYAKQIGSTIGHLLKFRGGDARLQDVDRKFIEDFIQYLRHANGSNGRPLRESSQRTYLDVFSVLLSRAVRSGFISKNPLQELSASDIPQMRCRQRSYLTIEDVRRLEATLCPNDDLKRAFLFCCFCGLRYSDIRSLTWKSIRDMGDGRLQIEIIQQKTQEAVYLPLSENAVAQLPQRREYDDPVFIFPGKRSMGKYLSRWAVAAGVDKHVTFHVARHTCATLLLTFGADLYTVSKLLGHTNVKTTQIYAKVVDEKKRAAVDLIPKL